MQNLHADDAHLATATVASLASGDVPVLSSIVSPSSPAMPVVPALVGDRALPPILVADDDPDDRFLIKRLITKTGTEHPVRTFDDGSEVVNYLGAIAASSAEVRQRAPKLLFLDLKMTGLGGFGFLQWIREQKNALPMTVVVLSNSVEPADMEQAKALGAERYLVKYPSVQTFSTIVRSVYPFRLAQ